MIPESMVVYWMMIFWLKQSDTCVNGGLLNDDTLIKTKGLYQSDTCVNGGLLNMIIKTKWYLCQWLNDDTLIKTKNNDTVSMVVY